MIRPGRGIADRAHLRLVEREQMREPMRLESDRPPCIACWIAASALTWGCVGLGLWAAGLVRWGRF